MQYKYLLVLFTNLYVHQVSRVVMAVQARKDRPGHKADAVPPVSRVATDPRVPLAPLDLPDLLVRDSRMMLLLSLLCCNKVCVNQPYLYKC